MHILHSRNGTGSYIARKIAIAINCVYLINGYWPADVPMWGYRRLSYITKP